MFFFFFCHVLYCFYFFFPGPVTQTMHSIIFDYAVFLLLIALSFAILIYSKISGPKEQTKADYVFASKGSVSMGAMLLSIARGFLGVKVFLGKYPIAQYLIPYLRYEYVYAQINSLMSEFFFPFLNFDAYIHFSTILIFPHFLSLDLLSSQSTLF